MHWGCVLIYRDLIAQTGFAEYIELFPQILHVCSLQLDVIFLKSMLVPVK